jgi:hypothetical protein
MNKELTAGNFARATDPGGDQPQRRLDGLIHAREARPRPRLYSLRQDGGDARLPPLERAQKEVDKGVAVVNVRTDHRARTLAFAQYST